MLLAVVYQFFNSSYVKRRTDQDGQRNIESFTTET